MITWPEAMQKYASCAGHYPACATAGVTVECFSDVALLYRFQVRCPVCGRVREPALAVERLRQQHGMELASLIFPLLQLPPAPPFGAGPAVMR